MRMLLVIIVVMVFGLWAGVKLSGGDSHYVEASIPPFGAIPKPEPETECENYSATAFMWRIETWLNTFQTGLQNSPNIETSIRECIVDMENIVDTDNFMLTACANDPNAEFITLARKALDRHLALCGASAQR